MKQKSYEGFINRRSWLKTAISLLGVTGLDGIFQTAIDARIKNESQETPVRTAQGNMNTEDRIESSWLTRQVGFQLAHEQFLCPNSLNLASRLIRPDLICSQ